MASSLRTDEETAEIYGRHAETVFRVCFSFMKNKADAEDMAQETFLKLLSSGKQFESAEHERAWLIVTASNTCKDELRSFRRRLEHIRHLWQQENTMAGEENSVWEWVQELPVKYRQVVYLYYYEGYRTPEIAEMLQCPESTVRNQLSRGRKLLKMKRAHKSSGKPAYFLAAALAGSLLVTTGVYAVRFLGLRDMDAGKDEVWDLSGIEPGAEDLKAEDIPVKEADFISLGALEGSPEYQACKEWNAFLEEYDADGALLAEIGNDIAGFGEYELVYNCYTQEMVDKVNEICGKYGISRLAGFQLADAYEDLCRRADIGDICGGSSNAAWEFYGGYSYEDGTFKMEGRAVPASSQCTMDYQFIRTMKGSFNPRILNIGEKEEYREWHYRTKSGEIVLLACCDEKALIIAEQNHSIIVVNVLGDLLEKTFAVSDEALEELADGFDFSEIP